jgi:hypothetical protein
MGQDAQEGWGAGAALSFFYGPVEDQWGRAPGNLFIDIGIYPIAIAGEPLILPVAESMIAFAGRLSIGPATLPAILSRMNFPSIERNPSCVAHFRRHAANPWSQHPNFTGHWTNPNPQPYSPVLASARS